MYVSQILGTLNTWDTWKLFHPGHTPKNLYLYDPPKVESILIENGAEY